MSVPLSPAFPPPLACLAPAEGRDYRRNIGLNVLTLVAAELDIYMSNGECFDACKASFNYAVVQYQSCWCANDLPDTSVSVSQCDIKCPGYGYESCGNKDAGLYGYIVLPNAPAGATIGGGSSSGSSSPQPSYSVSTTVRSDTSFVSSASAASSSSRTTSSFYVATSGTDMSSPVQSSTAPPPTSSSSSDSFTPVS